VRIKILAASTVATATLLGLSSTAYADSGTAPTPSSTAAPEPTAPPAGTAGGSCDPDREWPDYAQGAPPNFKAGSDGVFLWHNPTGGWSLRASHPRLPGQSNHVVFSGAISSAGGFGHIKGVHLEKNDSVKLSGDGHVLAFTFNNWGGVDGVDFSTSCTPGLKVGLKADGHSFSPRYIHLGAKDAHPGSDPFLIRRVSSDSATSAPTAAASPPVSSYLPLKKSGVDPPGPSSDRR